MDDDYDFLESLQLIMLEEGHRAYPVSNGQDAITQYKKIKPDMVFLDIKMPGVDGYKTFTSIKRYDPDAQIVFMSGHPIDNMQHSKFEGMMAGILNKPIRSFELKKLVKKSIIK